MREPDGCFSPGGTIFACRKGKRNDIFHLRALPTERNGDIIEAKRRRDAAENRGARPSRNGPPPEEEHTVKILTFVKTFLSCFFKIALIPIALVLFLLGVCLSLLFIDWRISAAILPFALVIVILLVAWCLPAGKAQKNMLRASGCIALASAIGIAAMTGVDLYEHSVTIYDTVSGDMRFPADYLPFNKDSDIARLPGAASEHFTLAEAPKLLTVSGFYPLTAAFVNAVYPETEFGSNGESDYLAVNRHYSFLTEGTYDVIIDRENATGSDVIDPALTESTVIGRDAVVLYTHKDNAVTDLTSEQLAAILTGRITNWREVGGDDLAIKLFTGHDLTCASDLLERYIGAPLADGETQWKFVFPYFAFAEYTTEYRNVAGALGFTYLSQIDEQYENTHFIAVDGTFADEETVQAGRYPIAENILAITRAGRSAEETRLISWILSDEGQTLVRGSGFVAAS